jgi:hypothetical protein
MGIKNSIKTKTVIEPATAPVEKKVSIKNKGIPNTLQVLNTEYIAICCKRPKKPLWHLSDSFNHRQF